MAWRRGEFPALAAGLAMVQASACATGALPADLQRHARPEYRIPPGLGLAEKARLFEERLARRFLSSEGVLIYRRPSAAPDALAGAPYGDLADAAAWTGALLAAEAYRAGLRGDPEALGRVGHVLSGVECLLAVTGVRGLLARTVDPAPHPGAEWHRGAAPHEGLWWRGDVSRDQYAGVVFGLGAVLETVGDPALRARAGEAAAAMADHLLDHGLAIVDVDGERTTHGDLRGRILGLPIGVNALIDLAVLRVAWEGTGREPYRRAYRRLVCRGYPRIAWWMKVQAFGRTNPSNDVMGFHALAVLLPREEDPEVRGDYGAALERAWSFVGEEGNALFAAVYVAARGLDAARAAASARETLRLFPLDRRAFEVDLRGARDIPRSFWRDRKGEAQASVALPVNLRGASSYQWKSSPYALRAAPGARGELEYSGVDYLAAYWLARRAGVVDADG
ncbi:MAG: hypothetical protein HY722_16265 [Planctomycetes bacterium]|nr:hypothetical protein [Planctomycetota bacterium]